MLELEKLELQKGEPERLGRDNNVEDDVIDCRFREVYSR